MIRLLTKIDAEARKFRKRYEDEVEAVENAQGEKIARARGRPLENAWVGQRFSDPPLDIPGIARSHGVQAIGTVTRVGDLAGALEEALQVAEGGAPVLVDVLCEQRVSASGHAEKGVETAGTGQR